MQSTKRYSLRFNNLQPARRLHDEIVPLFPGILITIGEESGAQYLLCAWIPDLTRPMLSDRLAERGVEINVDEGLSWEDYDREIEVDDEDKDGPTDPCIIEQLGLDPKDLEDEDGGE